MLFLQTVLNLILFIKHSRSTNSNPQMPEFLTFPEMAYASGVKDTYVGMIKRIKKELETKDEPVKSQIEKAIKKLEELLPEKTFRFTRNEYRDLYFYGTLKAGSEIVLAEYPEYHEAIVKADKKLSDLCKSAAIKG